MNYWLYMTNEICLKDLICDENENLRNLISGQKNLEVVRCSWNLMITETVKTIIINSRKKLSRTWELAYSRDSLYCRVEKRKCINSGQKGIH